MEDQQTPVKSDLSNLTFKDLFFKYVRFLPLFIISVALALFVSYIYLRYATLVYRAVGSLVIRDDKKPGTGDKFDMLMSEGSKNIQNEIEVLRSRPLMERVVTGLGLNLTYKAKGNIKELNVYRDAPFRLETYKINDSLAPFILNLKFDGENRFRINDEQQPFTFGQVFQNKHGVFRLVRIPAMPINSEYNLEWFPTPTVVSRLSKDIVIAPKTGTGIIMITLEATNPKLAADVINRLMQEYQIATVEEKNEDTHQAIVFIDDRLRKVNRELDSITGGLLSYQQANNLIDFEAQSSSYFERIRETETELGSQRVRLNVSQMIEEYLRDKRNDYNTVPTSLGLEDPTLNTLISAFNVAQLERKVLLDKNVPRGNMLVREKEEQIEKLRQNILENLRNIRSSYTASINNLQEKNTSVQSQIRALPVKQQNLIEIRRQQESKLAVYNFLMEKREESAISLASTISNTKVLEEATVILTPVKPNRRNAQMLAIVIGMVIPALFIFVLEILNDKVTTRNDIEKITGATILGELGHSNNKETLVVTSNNRSVVAEQFRIIRSNLQYILNNINKPVILITSSFSGEGKSFISTNIGAVQALAGKKTIILEFDIRKPKILSELHIAKQPGLTNFLLGKAKLEDLPIPVPGYGNLFVLSSGPIPPNPSELLLDPRLNDLFAYLRANFDVVIMDTAPVGMVSDAMTLGSQADCTLYIVRQGYTYKKQIGLIDDLYRQNKLPKVSLILNDVKLRTGYGYYGYGRYGYGKGYGSGYFEDDDPPPTVLSKWFGWMDLKKWKKKRPKTHKA